MEFRTGQVLAKTWNVTSRNAATFLLLVGVLDLIPTVAKSALPPVSGWWHVVDFAVDVSISSFAHVILVWATFQELRGVPVDTRASVSRGLSRLLPVCALSLVHMAGLILGTLLCIAPGLAFLSATAVCFPVCVLERLNPIASLYRSAELTRGCRWPILALTGSWWCVLIGLSVVTSRAIPVVQIRPVLIWLWGIPWSVLYSVLTAVLYYELRAVQEGFGLDEIAAVFD